MAAVAVAAAVRQSEHTSPISSGARAPDERASERAVGFQPPPSSTTRRDEWNVVASILCCLCAHPQHTCAWCMRVYTCSVRRNITARMHAAAMRVDWNFVYVCVAAVARVVELARMRTQVSNEVVACEPRARRRIQTTIEMMMMIARCTGMRAGSIFSRCYIS